MKADAHRRPASSLERAIVLAHPDPTTSVAILENAWGAAYSAALMNVLADPKIDGIYFLAWSVLGFQLNWLPEMSTVYQWYTSPFA